jgi:uncharacterized protein YlxW (UPF0749 family)
LIEDGSKDGAQKFSIAIS